MKQILQNLKTGATEMVDVPAPAVGRGRLLIGTSRTLVSSGTERMLVDFGQAGWIEKARQQPEKVRQVIDKIRTDGLIPTVEAVFNKLDEPMPLGYCNAGVVLEVGPGITDLQPSDRVASNGPHAEVACVPRNLCAKIPDGVSDDEAAFTVLGSIALQGVRLATPTLGEKFMVFGLGLVGLLTVQLLKASGCAVLAIDVCPARLRLAEVFGAQTVNLGKGTDPVAAALAWTGGRGVDGALIAAAAKGDEIVHQAAQACRTRGRIILVGVVDLNLRRDDFYKKELTFQVSCSYGPGRYDEKYEQAGQDYPLGFVRWTEQRNFEAVLEAMRTGQLQVKELITHRLALAEAAEAYGRVLHDPEALGIVIEYPDADHEGGRNGTATISEEVSEKMGQTPFLLRKKGVSPYFSESVPIFPMVMVGFNRRFSPHTVRIKELLGRRTEPLCMTLTVNAGYIPPEHWTQDPERGGGRIIGEGCHFIDLLSHLAGSPVSSVSATMVGRNGPVREDKMSILLGFANGSVGTVHYFANGSKAYPKETLEIFGDGRVIRMENFRHTTGFGFKGFHSFRTWRQDKGHRTEIAEFVERVASGGPPLIPFEQIVNVTRASFAAVTSAKTGSVIKL